MKIVLEKISHTALEEAKHLTFKFANRCYSQSYLICRMFENEKKILEFTAPKIVPLSSLAAKVQPHTFHSFQIPLFHLLFSFPPFLSNLARLKCVTFIDI